MTIVLIEVWALFWRVGSLEKKANQLGSRYLGVSKKYGYPKLDGFNNFNEKPYDNGWFGGTIIFGNTIPLKIKRVPWGPPFYRYIMTLGLNPPIL